MDTTDRIGAWLNSDGGEGRISINLPKWSVVIFRKV
jgi:hypothetical protein